MAEVVLKDIVNRFGSDTPLEDISLTIPDEAFVVLLGPTGAGKATTLRVIAGLEKPAGGDVIIDGVSVHARHPLFFDAQGRLVLP